MEISSVLQDYITYLTAGPSAAQAPSAKGKGKEKEIKREVVKEEQPKERDKRASIGILILRSEKN